MAELDNKVFQEELRGWIGTPFHHRACVKGVGVDCLGLLLGALRNTGIYDDLHVAAHWEQDMKTYGREPVQAKLLGFLNEYFSSVPKNEVRPCDLLVFSFGSKPRHVGFLLDDNILIHGYERYGKVVSHRYGGTWKRLTDNVFRIPGIV